MLGTMVNLRADGEYRQTYQKVQTYLAQHFTRLPKVDLYYDAKGTIRSENQQHQIGAFGLIVVQIQGPEFDDAIGLLLVNDHVELDAVSASCVPELRKLCGYHEEVREK